MPFEDIPEDREISVPCECGGNITETDDVWSCDNCDFQKDNRKKDSITGNTK